MNADIYIPGVTEVFFWNGAGDIVYGFVNDKFKLPDVRSQASLIHTMLVQTLTFLLRFIRNVGNRYTHLASARTAQ